MENLPHEHLVEVLKHLPRSSLLDVAQTSTTLLRAVEDPSLWPLGDDGGDAFAPDPDGGGPRGIARAAHRAPRSDGVVRLTTARWIASTLRLPYQLLLPLVRFEVNTEFTLKVATHSIADRVARSEALAPDEGVAATAVAAAAEAAEDANVNIAGELPGVRARGAEDAWLMSLSTDVSVAAAADASAAARAAVANVETVARRLASALEREARLARESDVAAREEYASDDDEDDEDDEDGVRARPTRRRRWRAIAAAAESVRADRGCVRVRLSSPFIVAAALVRDPVSPAVEVAGTTPPPWSRDVPNSTAGPGEVVQDVVLRQPSPTTAWSALRASVVGEAICALRRRRRDGGGDDDATRHRGWGPAVRAVLSALETGKGNDGDGGEGDADADADSPAAAAAAAGATGGGFTDARAGIAWPALVRDPDDPALGVGDARDAGASSSPARRPRGFVVGGCKCEDALSDAIDVARLLNGGGTVGYVNDDDGAAVLALALLSYVPRAHECVLASVLHLNHRWRRCLSEAADALSLRRELCASSFPAAAGDDESMAATTRGLERVGELDATHAIMLEMCGMRAREARDQREPCLAASGATRLAAAAEAARAAAERAREAGESDDAVERAREGLMLRTRDALTRALVAVGVLEDLEGDG